jgi:hypothetical protein
MTRSHFGHSAGWLLLGALACAPADSNDDAPPAAVQSAAAMPAPVVDSEAVRLLQASLDYLGNLPQFSVQVTNVREDLLDSGQRVDLVKTATATVSRPDKIRGSRLGAGVEQDLIYDGQTLTLYNPPERVYASVPAPPTIPEMFQFASDSLGLYIPITDLVWPDVFPLMMEDVTLAMVVDQELIGGVVCNHLLFSRPGVDFQIWIPAAGRPLPLKYIVTDPSTPARLSIISTLSDWNVNPVFAPGHFTFVPPAGTQAVPFLPLGD